jgi:shikimate kinase
MGTEQNLVLTGFMGTGKTPVGKVLAEKLAMECVDTDAEIEARHGPIPEIFTEHGEDAFRQFEREMAAELGERSGLVIATGGKMMLEPTNVDALGRHGVIFCLVAAPDEILARVTRKPGWTERPLLAAHDPRQRIVDLLTERTDGYAQFTQITTDDASPDAIADEIVDLWNRRAH